MVRDIRRLSPAAVAPRMHIITKLDSSVPTLSITNTTSRPGRAADLSLDSLSSIAYIHVSWKKGPLLRHISGSFKSGSITHGNHWTCSSSLL